jgi:hypothetical protein
MAAADHLQSRQFPSAGGGYFNAPSPSGPAKHGGHDPGATIKKVKTLTKPVADPFHARNELRKAAGNS